MLLNVNFEECRPGEVASERQPRQALGLVQDGHFGEDGPVLGSLRDFGGADAAGDANDLAGTEILNGARMTGGIVNVADAMLVHREETRFRVVVLHFVVVRREPVTTGAKPFDGFTVGIFDLDVIDQYGFIGDTADSGSDRELVADPGVVGVVEPDEQADQTGGEHQ